MVRSLLCAEEALGPSQPVAQGVGEEGRGTRGLFFTDGTTLAHCYNHHIIPNRNGDPLLRCALASLDILEACKLVYKGGPLQSPGVSKIAPSSSIASMGSSVLLIIHPSSFLFKSGRFFSKHPGGIQSKIAHIYTGDFVTLRSFAVCLTALNMH